MQWSVRQLETGIPWKARKNTSKLHIKRNNHRIDEKSRWVKKSKSSLLKTVALLEWTLRWFRSLTGVLRCHQGNAGNVFFWRYSEGRILKTGQVTNIQIFNRTDIIGLDRCWFESCNDCTKLDSNRYPCNIVEICWAWEKSSCLQNVDAGEPEKE